MLTNRKLRACNFVLTCKRVNCCRYPALRRSSEWMYDYPQALQIVSPAYPVSIQLKRPQNGNTIHWKAHIGNPKIGSLGHWKPLSGNPIHWKPQMDTPPFTENPTLETLNWKPQIGSALHWKPFIGVSYFRCHDPHPASRSTLRKGSTA